MNQLSTDSLRRALTLLLCCTLLLLINYCVSAPTDAQKAQAKPNHQLWTELLQQHVNAQGMVNYKGLIQDSAKLNVYLNELKAGVPNPKTWTREEQLAYWINTYNAFTVKLIIDKYPLQSIKDLNSTVAIPMVNSIWDKRFFTLGGKRFSLNMIEHGILRDDYNEPRIHFAINCASISCPKLRLQAYTPESLEQQLEEQAYTFINNPAQNRLDATNPKLSSIFSWFSGDFEKKGSLIAFVNRYAETKINHDATVSYLDYDWGLNEQ